MKGAPQKIYDVVTPITEGLGYELVGIEWLAQGNHSLLRIYIDTDSGVKVEDCERVSHQLSGVLDVEDVVPGQYQLEISSPGTDRPLFTVEHFERYIGSEVKLNSAVPVNGQRKFKGVISAVEGSTITLSIQDDTVDLSIQNIQKANLIPNSS